MNQVSFTKRLLTRKYVSALTFIACLSMAGFLLATFLIETQKSAASIVNASGRRRYASQRIALFATVLVTSNSISEKNSVHRELETTIEIMEKNHEALIYGDPTLNIPGKNSKLVMDIYFSEPTMLHARLVKYLTAAKRLLAAEGRDASVENPDYQYILKNASSSLLADLDRVVNAYQKESDEDVERLRWVEFGILSLTLGLLVVIARFIFRPMVLEIEKGMLEAQANVQLIEKRVEERTHELVETHRELEIQKTKNIESARLASLGEVSGGIAHEINTPLTVITLRAAQIKKILKTEPINRVRAVECLEAIESVAMRIATIIKALRTFSRNAGGDPFVLTTIKSLIDDALMLCAERMKNNGIRWGVELGDMDLAIECQPVQIVQVFLNLLSNADCAVGSLYEKWIVVGVQDKGEKVEVFFTDSGHGIPAHIQSKLFQPFFSTKDVGEGTGLGLSISRGIVESHGGRIFIDSASLNTRFVLELPKRQAKPLGAAA